MATFGTTSEAGTEAGGSADVLVATKYTLTEDGTVSKISVYSSASVNSRGGIYSDNAGVPNALIVGNNTSVGGSGWKDIALTPTFLTAGVYWIVANQDGNNGRAYKAGGSSQTAYKTGVTFANDLPSTFPTPTGYQDVEYVSYGTYTTTGTNMKVNVGNTLKAVSSAQVNVGGNWKSISAQQVNVNNVWKNI